MSGRDLERFVLAQDNNGIFGHALEEIRAGRKVRHWMWFVFPQVEGLGRSAMATTYALSGLQEAREYLRHPVLGPRLRQCCEAALALDGVSAEEVFGPVDAQKLRSSMTLFSRAAPDEPLFGAVLEAYFDGRADPATDELLA